MSRGSKPPPLHIREYLADRALYEADPAFAESLGLSRLPPLFPPCISMPSGEPVWESLDGKLGQLGYLP